MTKQKEEFEVPINWSYPEDLKTNFVTNLVVQHTDQEFILSFFETLPPLLLGEVKKEDLKSVNAKCVARVVVTPKRMEEFINVMQSNLNIFKQKLNQKD